MRGLIKKELVYIFCSVMGVVFSVSFFFFLGALLWLIPGRYNILDNGYATLDSFFRLVPILFIILIPALAMRSVAEEKRVRTLSVIRSYPIDISSVVVSKILAIWIFVIVNISISSIYVFSVNAISLDGFGLDVAKTVISYGFIVLLALIFIVLSVFSSSIASNQFIALIISIAICAFIFYGFELFSVLFSDYPSVQLFVSSLGINYHFSQMQRGVLQLSDLVVSLNYILLFYFLTLFYLKQNKKRKYLIYAFCIPALFSIVFLFIPDIRVDFTEDRRYTLSDYSKNKLNSLAKSDKDIKIDVYLAGDLNAGFLNLQKSVSDILTDFRRESKNRIIVQFIDPYSLANTPRDVSQTMVNKGLNGIVLNETHRDGKAVQSVVYPYAQIVSGGDTLSVNLLKIINGYTAEENLNASAESLEFELMDGIRLLLNKDSQEIAFIEGHGEIEEQYVEDATALLSKYFTVNRGLIVPDVSVLDNFKVVIIAGTKSKFSEPEKYVLDQYIMKGGRVLWLIDGVYLSRDKLNTTGQSAGIKNETNLDDLLFTYGIRVNPVLIQDLQCTPILLSSNDENVKPTVLPFFYSPLLIPSQDQLVTKGLTLVKSSFVSSIDFVNKSGEVNRSVLLTTSQNAHIVTFPGDVSFDVTEAQSDKDYFNQQFLVTGVALEGKFASAFQNRMIPDSVNFGGNKIITTSKYSKMIVVGSSDVIRNEIIGQGDQTQILPIGYDRVAEKQYGNRDFIVNAVNWLANDDDWMLLKNKQQKIRLLDRQKVYELRDMYALINVVFPILLMIILIGVLSLFRKYKNTR